MRQRPVCVEVIVMVICILHNLMLMRYEDADTHKAIPGTWRDNEALLGLQATGQKIMSASGKHQCDYLMPYYNSPAGSVACQEDVI